jgi:hypothetical protein
VLLREVEGMPTTRSPHCSISILEPSRRPFTGFARSFARL